MTFPTLETDRLIMRDWRLEDLDGVFEMQSDEEWARYMGGPILTKSEAWRTLTMFAGHRLFRGYTNWVLEEKETGAYVGRVGPWFPEGWPDVEIGWSVLRSRWGRGYALEAARAAARWVHDELHLDHVIHLIDPENRKSERVAEKLGGEPTEMFRMPFRDGREVRIWRTRLPLAG